MKLHLPNATFLLAAGLTFATASLAPALVRYADCNSTNAAPPYTNWAMAAVAIQDAVDAAAPGDEIVVTNGAYAVGAREMYGSNRVAVTKPVTVRSVNGPTVTMSRVGSKGAIPGRNGSLFGDSKSPTWGFSLVFRHHCS
jgi:hypothetical protein